MNLADWALGQRQVRRWLGAFLAAAGPDGPKPRLVDSGMSSYEYLGRTNGTVYFNFTFSEKMELRPFVP